MRSDHFPWHSDKYAEQNFGDLPHSYPEIVNSSHHNNLAPYQIGSTLVEDRTVFASTVAANASNGVVP